MFHQHQLTPMVLDVTENKIYPNMRFLMGLYYDDELVHLSCAWVFRLSFAVKLNMFLLQAVLFSPGKDGSGSNEWTALLDPCWFHHFSVFFFRILHLPSSNFHLAERHPINMLSNLIPRIHRDYVKTKKKTSFAAEPPLT